MFRFGSDHSEKKDRRGRMRHARSLALLFPYGPVPSSERAPSQGIPFPLDIGKHQSHGAVSHMLRTEGVRNSEAKPRDGPHLVVIRASPHSAEKKKSHFATASQDMGQQTR